MRAVNGYKECSGCKQSLEVSFFTSDKSMADGLDFYCKDCRKRRNATPERRAAGRSYSKTEKARKRSREANRQYYKKNRDALLNKAKGRNKEKKDAVSKVNCAVRGGKLVRPNRCEHEDETCYGMVEAHHPDYSKPLDVVWLCKSHHAREHIEMKERETENDRRAGPQNQI